jgi:hypothetical protein
MSRRGLLLNVTIDEKLEVAIPAHVVELARGENVEIGAFSSSFSSSFSLSPSYLEPGYNIMVNTNKGNPSFKHKISYLTRWSSSSSPSSSSTLFRTSLVTSLHSWGRVCSIPKRFPIATVGTVLAVLTLQRPGSMPMTVPEFRRSRLSLEKVLSSSFRILRYRERKGAVGVEVSVCLL